MTPGPRNDRWFDAWSVGHFASGVVLGMVMDPFWALLILIAWEPFEILVLGPTLWKTMRKKFGFESWKNAMADVWFDAAGVAIGAYVFGPL